MDFKKSLVFLFIWFGLGLISLNAQDSIESNKEMQTDIKNETAKCNAGNAEACDDLGALYVNGREVKQDWTKSFNFFLKGCNLNYMESCLEVGYIYYDGKAPKKDFAKAKEYFLKACNGKAYFACHKLGDMYYEGQGVKKDYAKAREYYTKACDGDVYQACANLSYYIYVKAKDVKKDYVKASEYARKACEGNDAIGCFHLAALYEKGEGIKQSKFKANLLYYKSCNLGFENACDKDKELEQDLDSIKVKNGNK